MTPNISVYLVGEVDCEGGRYIVGIYHSHESAMKAADAHEQSDRYDGGEIRIEIYEVQP